MHNATFCQIFLKIYTMRISTTVQRVHLYTELHVFAAYSVLGPCREVGVIINPASKLKRATI